jgi:hypothetical protein
MERQIELERRRRERGIDLTVQVWYDDNGIKYNRPRIITLKEDDRLFDLLNRLVPAEAWGLVAYETGQIWYNRHRAANPTSQNRWAEFDLYEAQEFVDRRQVYLHDVDNPADIPTIFLQDIRHIEKMPTVHAAEPEVGELPQVGEMPQQLQMMSECLLTSKRGCRRY